MLVHVVASSSIDRPRSTIRPVLVPKYRAASVPDAAWAPPTVLTSRPPEDEPERVGPGAMAVDWSTRAPLPDVYPNRVTLAALPSPLRPLRSS